MKIHLYILTGLFLLGSGYTYAEKTTKASYTFVANEEGRILPSDKFEELLEAAIKEIREDERYDNFILFVHGRGQHPEKAYRKSLISDLESNYSAKVIMFNWPSWNGPLGFPEENARKSAKDFSLMLTRLKKYREDNQLSPDKIKFTLITQSMGSIVLEESILKHDCKLNGIFDMVVICSSASSSANHAEWVNKIGLSDKIYITVNNNDHMLGRAGIKMKRRMLGKWLQTRDGNTFKLAQNAKYVDLTGASLRHHYYLHKDLKKTPEAKSFFDEVLNGLPASFNDGSAIKEINSDRRDTQGEPPTTARRF